MRLLRIPDRFGAGRITFHNIQKHDFRVRHQSLQETAFWDLLTVFGRVTLDSYRRCPGGQCSSKCVSSGRGTFDKGVSSEPLAFATDAAAYGFSIVTVWQGGTYCHRSLETAQPQRDSKHQPKRNADPRSEQAPSWRRWALTSVPRAASAAPAA